MTVPRPLLKACADIGRSLTPSHAEQLASALAEHPTRAGADEVAYVVPAAAFTATAKRLLQAWSEHPEVSGTALGPAIAASAHAHELARTDPHIQLVMSGPASHHLHSRMSDQVLLEVIAGAQTELLLVTYALYMYQDLKNALTSATARGVTVTVLAEDPADNKNYSGSPMTALAGIAADRLRWSGDKRPAGNTSLHAKIAIADRNTVLLTSANLTNKAANDNLEAGLLIKGGDLGERLSRHIDDLRANGILQPTG
jgi:phosphatidylserine/phosphatidylglycerophosphate/cardiolipin synthase-like enzyme